MHDRRPDSTTPASLDWTDPAPVPDPPRYVYAELASALQPWDGRPVRALRGFAREVARARARLAMIDPSGEREAVAPLSGTRARWILLELEEDDAAARRRPVPVAFGSRLESGRDLLTRLGANPHRWRGVMRCPAHEDREASLSWRLADDGRALVHCFAGCSFAEILAAAA